MDNTIIVALIGAGGAVLAAVIPILLRDYALYFPAEMADLRMTSSKKSVFQPAISRVPLIPCLGLEFLIRACASLRRVEKFPGPLPTRN